MLELKNLKTSLNGYEVSNPLNKKATQVEMHLFTSISPLTVLSKFGDSIRKYFNFDNINFSSFVLPSFTLIRDLFLNKEDFMFVDVGHSFTDVYLVRHGVLRESTSFPLGSNVLENINTDQVPLSLILAGHADHTTEKKFHPILEKAKNKWLLEFQNAVANISTDMTLPSLMYVLTENGYGDLFSSVIKNEEFSQYEKTVSKWEVILISKQMFHGMVKFDPNVTRDKFITIDSIYINRFLM
jgi:hypothetical protein